MTESTFKKTNWPVFRSLASFRPSDFPGDLIAGLTLAAIAIPEQMATARLGGFSPQIGFFAFMAGSLGFAMLGGNRFCPVARIPPSRRSSPAAWRCWQHRARLTIRRSPSRWR